MKLNEIIGPEVSTSYCIGFANSLKAGIRLSDEYENVMTKIKYTLSPFISKQFVCDVENSISDNEELKEYLTHWGSISNREFSSNHFKYTKNIPGNDTIPFLGRLTQEMIFAYFYGLIQFIHNTTIHETYKNYNIFLNLVSKKFCHDIDDERLFELMGFFDTHPIFAEIETSIFKKFLYDTREDQQITDRSPLHNTYENNSKFCKECNFDLGLESDCEEYCNDCRMIQYKQEYDQEYDQELQETIEEFEMDGDDQ